MSTRLALMMGVLSLVSCGEKKVPEAAPVAAEATDATPAADPDILLAEWTGPYGGVPPLDQVEVSMFTHTDDVQTRQCLVMSRVLRDLWAAGYDWMLQLDIDELLYLPRAAEREDARAFFSSVPLDVEQVAFHNHEVCACESLEVTDWFDECALRALTLAPPGHREREPPHLHLSALFSLACRVTACGLLPCVLQVHPLQGVATHARRL